MKEELNIYEYFKPLLREASAAAHIDDHRFEARELQGYTSVYFGSLLLFRIRYRGKKNYISFPKELKDSIPAELAPYTIKSEESIRVPVSLDDLDKFRPLIAPLFEFLLQNIPKGFDCCGYYEQCSDAGQCILTDQTYAMQCGYKRILGDGKVYFGKNRNV